MLAAAEYARGFGDGMFAGAAIVAFVWFWWLLINWIHQRN